MAITAAGLLALTALTPTSSLAYMSPEQTGRMNRSVDYRTDLYSLGATFYELFTGSPPFSNTDPLELIHAHIASTPAIGREEQRDRRIPGEIDEPRRCGKFLRIVLYKRDRLLWPKILAAARDLPCKAVYASEACRLLLT